MTTSDPLADMFTRIRNAANARHDEVRIPASKVKRAVAEVLKEEGFIRSIAEETEGPRHYLKLDLTYADDRRSVLTGIRRVSRPGLRVYVGKREIPRVYGGLGVADDYLNARTGDGTIVPVQPLIAPLREFLGYEIQLDDTLTETERDAWLMTLRQEKPRILHWLTERGHPDKGHS
jgi:small subunit ribosomal protein S8